MPTSDSDSTPSDALLIFTADPLQDCIDAANSAAWRLNRSRAQKMKYVILTRNAPDKGSSHRAAFLIAKIKEIIPRVDLESKSDGRYAIVFDQYAEIEVPDVWKRSQMPVKYVSAQAVLRRPPEEFTFKPVGKKILPWSYSRRMKETTSSGVRKLTIAEAKEGLAAQFGCSPSAIEITIRA